VQTVVVHKAFIMTKNITKITPLYRPNSAFDLLKLPIVGRLLRWRWGRLALQVPLVMIALAMLWDGFTGPQQASRNVATVSAWVHYRGLVVIALLLVGNLFCMACPFTLPRTLGKRFAISGRRFPKLFRNKYLAIAGLFALFFLYEWLDLWASPLLTAWVIVFYFVASFVLELVFSESAFCKYVCPLGTFNFVYSTLAPTQIGVHNQSVCASCTGKECVNGSYAPQSVIHIDTIPVVPTPTLQHTIAPDAIPTLTREVSITHSPQGTLGCGTLLYAPQIQSNLDCTLCLDCVRACPHQNVGLFVRPSGRELTQQAWGKRWDVAFLVIALAFMALTNAFGMVPPVYELQIWLTQTLGIQNEAIVLLVIFGVGNLLLPLSVMLGTAWLSRLLMPTKTNLREIVTTFAPSFVPLGFGVWLAHYGFHFLIAPFSIVPVIQEFLGQTGDWTRWSVALDSQWIGIIQVVALAGGFLGSLWVAQKNSTRAFKRYGFLAMLPWALVLLVMVLVAWQIFSLPMEMRGSEFLG
jgi:polyferredoxin